MIKNTIIVTQTEAARAYFDCMMDHLTITREELHFKEFSDDFLTLATEVSKLMSRGGTFHRAVAHEQFAELFRIGSTMMLVPNEMETLEKWADNNEDFQLAVFTDEGEPIGVFKNEQVTW